MTKAYRAGYRIRTDKHQQTREAQIGSRIEVQPDGCWLYGRGRKKTSTAYPMIMGDDGKTISTHRWVYEVLVGPIPEGHHLHHECGNTRCCNPAHLTPLTPSDHGSAHHPPCSA